MIRKHWGGWAALLWVSSCNGKLVLPDPNGAAGSDAGSGSSAGAAGRRAMAGSGGDDSSAGAGGGNAGDGPTGGWDTAGSGGHIIQGGSGGSVIQGGSGGTFDSGQLGRSCIPGGTVSDGSGVAKTDVVTFERCAAGLSCNAQGKCAETPDCPQATGSCVIRRPVLEGPGAAGAGSMGGSGGSEGVQQRAGVQDMTGDATRLYWVEYGTRDALGNYQSDGVLKSYAFADAAQTTLDDHLAGPLQVAVTANDAYVFTDGGGLIDSAADGRVRRIPLSGGTGTELGAFERGYFVTNASKAFWSDYYEWYVADASGWTKIPGGQGANMGAADATDLYFASFVGLSSLPIAGGTVRPVASASHPFALARDLVYGVEPVGGDAVLNQVAKSGGTYARIRALGSGSPRKIAIVGDRYFVSLERRVDSFINREDSILTGLIAGDSKPVRLVQVTVPNRARNLMFVATSTTLYWSDGGAIYRREVSDPVAP